MPHKQYESTSQEQQARRDALVGEKVARAERERIYAVLRAVLRDWAVELVRGAVEGSETK